MKSKTITYLLAIIISAPTIAADVLEPQTRSAVNFDLSLPLHMMAPKPIVIERLRGGSIIDPGVISNDSDAPFFDDPALQSALGQLPGPVKQSDFFALDNISGVSPPDPTGDVGPNHYVAMTNLSFAVLNKSGTLLYGPAANNTVWSGFGGACENENSGDPIVLYDQISDRWLLSQFTSAGPQYYNCVAISQTSDPTGAYYRWAILNNNGPGNGNQDLFPDYPKYGIWSDAFYISTRDFSGGSYEGVGAYALNRADLVSGNPSPGIIYFYVPRGTSPWQVGDGLLPADLDGMTLPPNGSPQYFVGTMDDGAGYSAAEDALTFWEFHADFNNISNSSFTRTAIISMTDIDTQFPCVSGRNCIPQLGTTNGIDIQSYRQRPLHRLAYRNFGSHESLVTNQSVEASAGMAGIRWWEIRDLDTTPTLFQEGTFGPGATDGIHRWMGSIAQDGDGNMGLAYSASSANMNPAIRFTGRLVSDSLGVMDRTEGSIIEGTGSQTGSQRWGDYTSTNIDPLDDCTFWHVNEYLNANGGDWQIRVGSFKFDECGDPGFYLNATTSSQAICVSETANYALTVGPVGGFNDSVTLSANGTPGAATSSFTVNPIPSLPGNTTLTIGNTAGLSTGNYAISVLGTAAGVSNQSIDLSLNVFAMPPEVVTLDSPTNNAVAVDLQPSLNWTGTNALNYTVEVASDSNFNNIVFSDVLSSNTVAPTNSLASNTTYYWRVKSANSCGESTYSSVYVFTTMPAPGDCPLIVSTAKTAYANDFDGDVSDWGSSSLNGSNSWDISNNQSVSGANSFYAADIGTTSDTVLISPQITLPLLDELQNNLTLQFWNKQTMESNGAECWDGGMIEISTDSGNNFTQISNDKLLTDPYDGPYTSGLLSGADAWCGDPQAWLNSVIDLTDWAGMNVVFRFRITTDGSVAREGWYLDDFKVQSCEYPDLIFEDGFEAQL
ncbi:Ig-like domain-containing protein [Marinicella litoralis]|uniref:Fibronectin type-III domain-containing protein n=1 Tax=Marinicella litoralis TaxID=644220 RepID=A0A4R6XFZ5_9GAMM|nr:Ig-like domain-containing protein [Marinicella litoralis]TDR18295.1 hypothetical protein C8D91_2211 [Marinicella litoralis]